VNNQNKVVSFAPPKSIPSDKFIQSYNEKMEGIVAEEFVEGTMINVFWDPSVGLTGGLGNQLFQLAAGLSATKKGVLYLHWSLGKPRISESGLPEIASFSLPKNVCLELNDKVCASEQRDKIRNYDGVSISIGSTFKYRVSGTGSSFDISYNNKMNTVSSLTDIKGTWEDFSFFSFLFLVFEEPPILNKSGFISIFLFDILYYNNKQKTIYITTQLRIK
jgi:hypothetical protein